MADSKISALPAATSVAGSDVLPIVQSATTKQVSFTNVFKSPPALGTTTPAAVKATTLEATGNVTMANGTSLLSGTDTVLYVDANYTVLRGKATNGILFQDSAGTTVGQFTPTANDFKVNVGNVVIGTSGKGIDFSATPGTGTSELLADYEEGTFTPNQGAGLTVVGTFSSAGIYTKIGNVVTAIIRMAATTSIATTAGGVVCTNLPFTANSSRSSVGSITTFNVGGGFCQVGAGSTTIYASSATTASTGFELTITYAV